MCITSICHDLVTPVVLSVSDAVVLSVPMVISGGLLSVVDVPFGMLSVVG